MRGSFVIVIKEKLCVYFKYVEFFFVFFDGIEFNMVGRLGCVI